MLDAVFAKHSDNSADMNALFPSGWVNLGRPVQLICLATVKASSALNEIRVNHHADRTSDTILFSAGVPSTRDFALALDRLMGCRRNAEAPAESVTVLPDAPRPLLSRYLESQLSLMIAGLEARPIEVLPGLGPARVLEIKWQD
jgi:hypothetical protein